MQSKESQEKEYAINITHDHTLLLEHACLQSQTCMRSQSHVFNLLVHCTHVYIDVDHRE